MGADQLRSRQVLVTGGAGFIGSHLADALVRDNEVTVYDSLARGRREHVPDPATLVDADIREEERLAAEVGEVDVVFHEAALVSVAQSVEEPAESHAINLSATLALLEAARRHDVRVILASSAAIYGRPEAIPIDEDHPTRPSSPYGLQKLGLDHYARMYHDLYGLETVALRYFNAYGPRQTGGDYAGVITAFREQAAAGGPLTIEGDGTQTRDFVHVDDVVRANLRAATAEAAVGRAINIGTGEETPIRELAETVVDLADTRPEVTHVDPRPGDIDRSVADVSRARDLLDFRAEVSLRDGLAALMGSAD